MHHPHLTILRHGPVPNYRMAVGWEDWGHGRGAWFSMIMDKWVAAQGSTRNDAVRSLRSAVTTCYRFGWLDDYEPAPEEYQILWRGRHLWTGTGACLLAARPMLTRRICTDMSVPKCPPRRKRVSTLVPGRDIPEGFSRMYRDTSAMLARRRA